MTECLWIIIFTFSSVTRIMKWKLSISHSFLSQQRSGLAEFPLTNAFTVGLLIEVIGQNIQSADKWLCYLLISYPPVFVSLFFFFLVGWKLWICRFTLWYSGCFDKSWSQNTTSPHSSIVVRMQSTRELRVWTTVIELQLLQDQCKDQDLSQRIDWSLQFSMMSVTY